MLRACAEGEGAAAVAGTAAERSTGVEAHAAAPGEAEVALLRAVPLVVAAAAAAAVLYS